MQKPSITIAMNDRVARVPMFIRRAQRHLEKGKFSPISTGTHQTFRVPTDLLSLTLPQAIVDTIEELDLVYSRKTPRVGSTSRI